MIFPCALLPFAAAALPAQTHKADLKLLTSDRQLQQAFDWAKSQALAYVSSGRDAAAPWYEAALPGRNAFCMRDVSHQVAGAAALGLASENKHMLMLFAKNIAASRDWASYWEIDRDGKPSSADYLDDEDFWYNLPANFDVTSAALRMFMWTGDEDYVNDPAFTNFYKRTMTDYIQRWQLEPGNLLSRQRIMNRHLTSGKFVEARGIPSYSEGRADFTIGIDLLASAYRALRWYAELIRLNGSPESAATFDADAARIDDLLEKSGWNKGDQHFYGFLKSNSEGFESGDAFMLYFDSVSDLERRRLALKELERQAQRPDPGIEEQSYRPEIFFRYDMPELAYSQILDLANPGRKRREYPEVSYAIVGSIVTGMMGVEVTSRDHPGAVQSLSRDVVVQTLPRLSSQTSWAELDGLPVRHNVINIRHSNNRSTSITNVSGPEFTWRARYNGFHKFLRVNGKEARASHTRSRQGGRVTYCDIDVPSGKTVVVSDLGR